ncbi:MAG: glycoside hydrolase family 6 protein [Microbacteriaceae bacterium]
MASLSRRSIAAISVAALLAFVAVVAFVFSILVTPADSNPFAGQTLYVNPDSTAAQAAASSSGEEQAAAARIAAVATGIWITPEQHDTRSVASFVRGVVADAATALALPVLVVYGIPDRDCSTGLSSGGTTSADYPDWVGEIAAGIGEYPAVVILEPDSLASIPSCDNEQERVGELSAAIEALGATPASIYLDGGHSSWLSAADQAALLTEAGVAGVRGFASNVANYNTTADELAYDEQVSELVGGSHFVIDTSRNGNGSNGEWCNPSGRALGEEPAATDDVDGHDANLWVKVPGESDGTCNGGPEAGQWWAEMALELTEG